MTDEKSLREVLFQQCPDLIVTIDGEGQIIECNPAWTDVLGYKAVELIGQMFTQFVHPDDRTKSQQEARRLLEEGGRTISFVNRFLSRAGNTKTFHWSAFRHGEQLFGIGRDMTHMASNRERMEHFVSLVQNSKDAIIGMDLNLKIQTWNKGAEKIFGYTSAEAVGREVKDILLTQEQTIADLLALKSIVSGEDVDNFETRRRHKDGRLVDVSISVSPIRGADGGMEGVSAIIRDITDLKEAQLQAFSASRLAAVGEIAASLAHEIVNPLAIIKGLSMSIRKASFRDEEERSVVTHKVGRIENAINRLVKLVQGIGHASRSGENDEIENVSLQSIVENAADLCLSRLKYNSVELTVGNIPEVQIACRDVEISHVLTNLVTNAFHAIKDRPQKWIRLSYTESDDEICINVTDSGPGIPAEIQEKMMRPLFTTKEKGVGTGLGLSISKKIVRSHGGDLCYRELEDHTNFVVTLPKAAK